MNSLAAWEACALGMFGGVLAELLGIFRIRRQLATRTPKWFRSPVYWIVTTGMILAGGGLAGIYVLSGIELKAILAVNVGASAPLLIAALAGQTPEISPGRSN